MAIPSYHVKLTQKTDYGPRTSLYRLDFEEGVEFSFDPGQFVMIVFNDKDGKKTKRSYSIASSPHEKHFIELLITRHEGGACSTYLETVSVGDSLEIMGPLGIFKLKEPASDPVFFVATGAGLAPFRAMILKLFGDNHKGQITLLFGFRHEEDFLCEEELKKWDSEHDNFTLVASASQPQESWTGLKGRITTHVDEHIDPKVKPHIYLCGSTPMINELREHFTNEGLTREEVLFEKWG